MNIAVLMTCHNRRETTLRCLRSLLAQTADGADCGLEVFLVDDGSTDGTREAVEEFAKSAAVDSSGFAIHVVSGNGSLYWAKGMALAWQTALKDEERSSASRRFASFLWLNDDVELRPEALKILIDACAKHPDSVVVGELENSSGEIVYGKRGELFTGNFVCVPRGAYEKLGMICGDYHHAWADTDYAVRCKRNGVAVVSCGVVGRSEGHPNRPSLKGLSFSRRCRMLTDPKGWCVHDLWLYRRRNWGVLAAIASCVHLVVHVLIGER